MNKGLIAAAMAVSLTGTLIGCTIFPNPEPPRVMDLSISDPAYQADRALPYSLRVDTPHASEPFNSTRILAKPTAWEFRIYKGARWRDTAPVMVRDVLVQALRASRGFQNIVSDTSLADTDWTLITELSAFHTENHSGNVGVTVGLHAQIVDNRSKVTLCERSFTTEQPAEGAAINQVVEAFGTAGAKMSGAVTRWATRCNGVTSQETDLPTQPSDTGPLTTTSGQRPHTEAQAQHQTRAHQEERRAGQRLQPSERWS